MKKYMLKFVLFLGKKQLKYATTEKGFARARTLIIYAELRLIGMGELKL